MCVFSSLSIKTDFHSAHVFFEVGVLKKFAKLQENTCVESLFNKVAGY